MTLVGLREDISLRGMGSGVGPGGDPHADAGIWWGAMGRRSGEAHGGCWSGIGEPRSERRRGAGFSFGGGSGVKIRGVMTGSVPTAPLSVSTGDYIKAIWGISGERPASTKDISVRLGVAPASVTNMLGRLQEMGFVEYERYHGASLTSLGQKEALRLVRRHRLIETFLLEHLGYTWREVHAEADRLEHAVSDEFTERLAELLGHPEHDPHGDPIPTSEGILEPDDSTPLYEVSEGEEVRIAKVSDGSNLVLDYLGERGLVPGRKLDVKERREIDGMVVVLDEGGNTHHLGGPLARSVFVQRLGSEG